MMGTRKILMRLLRMSCDASINAYLLLRSSRMSRLSRLKMLGWGARTYLFRMVC